MKMLRLEIKIKGSDLDSLVKKITEMATPLSKINDEGYFLVEDEEWVVRGEGFELEHILGD
jgi:hypothetical protein